MWPRGFSSSGKFGICSKGPAPTVVWVWCRLTPATWDCRLIGGMWRHRAMHRRLPLRILRCWWRRRSMLFDSYFFHSPGNSDKTCMIRISFSDGRLIQHLIFDISLHDKIGFPDKWVDYDDLIIAAGDSLWEIKKKVSAFTFKKDLLKEINVPADKTKWFMAPQVVVNAYYFPLTTKFASLLASVVFLFRPGSRLTSDSSHPCATLLWEGPALCYL
ncbi:hypothetical protein BC830DRAFT_401427 [Chytriomyces sp. MP71]|nr:hypothetical protein BC830DRAFT_401427 [Chytriomyces sp. MP71]